MQFVSNRIVATGAVLMLCSSVQSGSMSLHDAAAAGNVDALPEILATVDDIDAPDASGQPAIVTATLHGNAEIVGALVDAGADTSARTDRGLTALHAAAFAGHGEIAELLIRAKANIDDNDNRFGIAPLHAAAEENKADIVALFLKAGANVQVTERNGYTPITRAGWREHWEIVEMLKSAGATCQPEALVGEWLYRHCNALPE